ncbi:MAG: UbiA family prenyltransferase [Candidatus Methanofastidiosia archaeon]
MRPKQWYKNVILFVGIVFSMNLLNVQMWQNVIAAFAIFCMLSGSEYIINDILDVEKDRKHPTKRKRPIVSGKLKKSHALLFTLVMIIFAGGGVRNKQIIFCNIHLLSPFNPALFAGS